MYCRDAWFHGRKKGRGERGDGRRDRSRGIPASVGKKTREAPWTFFYPSRRGGEGTREKKRKGGVRYPLLLEKR